MDKDNAYQFSYNKHRSLKKTITEKTTQQSSNEQSMSHIPKVYLGNVSNMMASQTKPTTASRRIGHFTNNFMFDEIKAKLDGLQPLEVVLTGQKINKDQSSLSMN